MSEFSTFRTIAILGTGRDMGLSDVEIMDRVGLALDVAPADNLDSMIRMCFTGEDDYDELKHELLHALGECVEDDPADCPWLDDE